MPIGVVPPADVGVRHGAAVLRFLGLPEAEAWALVDAFRTP